MTPPDKVQGNLVRLVYLHPPHRLGGALPGLRAGGALEPPLPLAPHPIAVLGPAGRRLGRGGRRLQRAHPRHRVDLGPAHVGGVVDLGRPAHHARRCSSCSSSGTWRCAGCRPTPRCRARRCAVGGVGRLRRRADRPLLGGLVADPAPGGDGAQRRSLADHPRFDGLDAAARVRRLHPRLRLDGGGSLPGRGARRRDRRARSSRSPWPSGGPRVPGASGPVPDPLVQAAAPTLAVEDGSVPASTTGVPR